MNTENYYSHPEMQCPATGTPPDNYNYDRHILNNHVHLTKQIINKWKHPG